VRPIFGRLQHVFFLFPDSFDYPNCRSSQQVGGVWATHIGITDRCRLFRAECCFPTRYGGQSTLNWPVSRIRRARTCCYILDSSWICRAAFGRGNLFSRISKDATATRVSMQIFATTERFADRFFFRVGVGTVTIRIWWIDSILAPEHTDYDGFWCSIRRHAMQPAHCG